MLQRIVDGLVPHENKEIIGFSLSKRHHRASGQQEKNQVILAQWLRALKQTREQTNTKSVDTWLKRHESYLKNLQTEGNALRFFEDLLDFAEQHRSQHPNAIQLLYTILLKELTKQVQTPGLHQEDFQSFMLRAQGGQQIILGQGDFFQQVQGFTERLPTAMQDWGMYAGLLVGPAGMALGRAFVGHRFSNLAALPKSLLGTGLGLGVEASFFTGAHQMVSHWQGHSSEGYVTGFGGALWLMSWVRLTGGLSQQILRSRPVLNLTKSWTSLSRQRLSAVLGVGSEWLGLYGSHALGPNAVTSPHMAASFSLLHFRLAGAAFSMALPQVAIWNHHWQQNTQKLLQQGVQGFSQSFYKKATSLFELGLRDRSVPSLAFAGPGASRDRLISSTKVSGRGSNRVLGRALGRSLIRAADLLSFSRMASRYRASGYSAGPMDSFDRLFMPELLGDLVSVGAKELQKALAILRRKSNVRRNNYFLGRTRAIARIKNINEALSFLNYLQKGQVPWHNLSAGARQKLDQWLKLRVNLINTNSVIGGSIRNQQAAVFWEAVAALPRIPESFDAPHPPAFKAWVHDAAREATFDPEASFIELAQHVDFHHVLGKLRRITTQTSAESEGRLLDDIRASLRDLLDKTAEAASVRKALRNIREISFSHEEAYTHLLSRKEHIEQLADKIRRVLAEAKQNSKAYLAFANPHFLELLRPFVLENSTLENMERFVDLPKLEFKPVPDGLRSHYHYRIRVPGMRFEISLQLITRPRGAPSLVRVQLSSPEKPAELNLEELPLVLLDNIPIIFQQQSHEAEFDYVSRHPLQVGAGDTIRLELIHQPGEVAPQHRFHMLKKAIGERNIGEAFAPLDWEIGRYQMELPIPLNIARGNHQGVARREAVLVKARNSLRLKRRRIFVSADRHPATPFESTLLRAQFLDDKGADWYKALVLYFRHRYGAENLGKNKENEGLSKMLELGDQESYLVLARMLYDRLGPIVFQRIQHQGALNLEDAVKNLSEAIFVAQIQYQSQNRR